MNTKTFKNIFQVLKEAGGGFMKDKVPKLSASLAYYTIFSLGPMMLVIIYLARQFYGQSAVEGTLHGQIRELVGDSAATQIQEIIKNAAITGESTLAVVVGVIALIVAATTVFAEIQDSINTIWRLRVKPEKGLRTMVRTRLQSFGLVIGLGFLLMVSLLINGLVEGFMTRLKELFPDATVIVLYIVNLALTLLIISTLFGTIFKVLPDAVIRWKDVGAGAFFTAILFMLGKFGITYYISNSNVDSAFGTAGSLVILLLWIYYSSLILYFGAEFTKFYALKFGSEIRPKDYAVTIQIVNVESAKRSLQENDEDEKKIEAGMQ